jgi:DNA-directed RNA polymerase beta subunit
LLPAESHSAGLPNISKSLIFLPIQTESFDWLVGNDAWQSRTAGVSHARSGLAEILDEISPIEDFSGTMSLSFSDPRFDEVKASIEECKEKDLTYCAPLFVTAEFTNNSTGEIKSQTVFMGDFPMMTPEGHVHHQRHRAHRCQPACPSPGLSTSPRSRTRPPTATSPASR